MPSHDELVAANAAIRKVLDEGAEATLRAIPGVHHVTVGLKVRDGIPSDDLSIRVYVREKKADSALSAAERIPREIEGIPTDVNVVSPDFRLLADARRVRPLKGGTLISNDVIDVDSSGMAGQMMEATFGCTATLLRDKSPVLLTNWHVLTWNGADIGDPIFQPSPLYIPNFPVSMLPKRKVLPDDDEIAFITDYKVTNRLDAGIARLDVSSCCRCCGLDFRDQILGLSDGTHPPANTLAGLREPVAGETVYKVGIATQRTVGRVLQISSPDLPPVTVRGKTYAWTGQITIVTKDPTKLFSDHGDSGAIIVGEDNYALGLLFGGNGKSPPADETYANHMGEVITALGIDLNYTPPKHSAGAPLPIPRTTFEGIPAHSGRALYETARARLLADPAGAWLWALAERHREEIVRLVTTHRPVSVTWHRAGGPAVFAQAIEILRSGGETLPQPPNGGTLEAGLARVGNALAAHGSPALRDAIEMHRATLLASVRDSTTVEDVLGKLRESVAALTGVSSDAY